MMLYIFLNKELGFKTDLWSFQSTEYEINLEFAVLTTALEIRSTYQ